MNFSRSGLLLVVLLLGAGSGRAQVAPLVTDVSLSGAIEGKPLSVGVTLAQTRDVVRVTIKYRSFGESEYQELEMLMAGRNATATIPGEAVLPPYIEYYIQADLQDGTKDFHPKTELQPGEEFRGPESTPLQIQVKERNPKDDEVAILSPEPGETVALEQLGITVSLFYASPAVHIRGTKLYLDGIDITTGAVLFDDMIVYSPKNFAQPLNLGTHFLRVELYDTLGKIYHTIESSFNLSTAAAIAEEKTRFRAFGSGQLEVRNEDLAVGRTTYVRGDIRTDASYSFLNVGANVHLDNQNTPNRQPQNRMMMYAEVPYFRLEIGDAFPRFPSLVVSGKRVRGITARLATGSLNLDVTTGQTERFIEGTPSPTDSTFSSLSAADARPRNTVRTTDDSTFNFFTPGTYTRNFFAVRPSFGSGTNFQWGLTYLTSKDDIGSATYAIDPKHNLVVGTDFTVAFDDQRVKWENQAALGVQNKDIINGDFTDADFDSMRANASGDDAIQQADNLENISKIAKYFITVNEFLEPINPMAKGLPGVAFESILSMNYFNNFIRAQFFRRGSQYRSFGNDFLQTDIQGFLVSDYLRLFSNRVFLSVSYEKKNDNLSSQKLGTTTYDNLNSSLTFSPGPGLPNGQLGFAKYSRRADNLIYRSGVNPDSTDFSTAADEATNRYFLGSSYEFSGKIRHTASMSMSISQRKDLTIFGRDQNNLYLQGALVSNFTTPLQTTVSVTFSNNENKQMLFTTDASGGLFTGQDSIVTSTRFNFTAVTLGANYRLLEGTLRLGALISPTFGDINRNNFQLAADYLFRARHNFVLQLDYIGNNNFQDETILSFIYRFNF